MTLGQLVLFPSGRLESECLWAIVSLMVGVSKCTCYLCVDAGPHEHLRGKDNGSQIFVNRPREIAWKFRFSPTASCIKTFFIYTRFKMAYGFPHIKENGQMLLIVVNLRSATLLENSQTCHIY